MVTSEAWEAYRAWAGAIASVVFPDDADAQPVYLDLEDEVLSRLGHDLDLELESDKVLDNLVQTVQRTISTGAAAGDLFAPHTRQLSAWTGADERSPHPPHLPLLAVFSLAAEQMSNGDGMGANNYYGRLAPLLGLESRRSDVATAYRKVATGYWGALNRWLTDLEGHRGLPTAYSLGADNHRYVGLAISQAVIRAADRAHLRRFFAAAGLPARGDVQPDMLTPALDAWIHQVPSPASKTLTRLWQHPALRERVAEAASVLLASWDGVSDVASGGAGHRASGQLRLACTLGGFLTKRFETRLLAYLPESRVERPLQVLTAGAPTDLEAVPTGAGPLVLAGSEAIDCDSLFDGLLRCRDTLSAAEIIRRPRRVVPLRRDDLLQQHVEVDQAVLGEDLMLVVEGSVTTRVEELLTESARPGWTRLPADLAGTPARFAVFKDVQFLRAPVSDDVSLDLRPLLPLSRSQLVISGGFAVPGRMRRWSVDAPPEVRVIDEGAESLRLVLAALDHSEQAAMEPCVLEEWSAEHPLLVVDLSAVDLEPGDYELAVHRNGAATPTSRALLRLRGADEVDALQWSRADALARSSAVPTAALGASPDAGAPAVRGAYSDELGRAAAASPVAASRVWWESASPVPPPRTNRTTWRLAAPDPKSCVFTGAHHLDYPPALPGKARRPFIEGTCRYCGVVKRGATSAWAAAKRNAPDPALRVTTADVHEAPTVRELGSSWDTALSVLGHLGGGGWSLLERTALQVEASGLFVDTFSRHLELLGHLEVARDPRTWAPTAWEVAPSVLAGLGDDSWALCGFWPAGLRHELHVALVAAGARLGSLGLPGSPTTWFSFDLPPDRALGLGELGVTVVPNAALRLAGHLPRLSDVIGALTRRSTDVVGDIAQFNLAGARWEPVKDLSAPGAYRVKAHAVLDLLRTPEDVAEGTARVSTVHLSKHAAAHAVGRVLAAYDPLSRELVVPLGADLPGLYGRAAVLCSGLIPVTRGRRLVYDDVPPDVAALIIDRLSS